MDSKFYEDYRDYSVGGASTSSYKSFYDKFKAVYIFLGLFYLS